MSWYRTVIDGGSEFENKKNRRSADRILSFIVGPLFAQVIVAAAQLVPLVLR